LNTTSRTGARGYAALKRLAYAAGEPLLRRAASAYVPGPALEDALHWASARAPAGVSFTFGYFNAEHEAATLVARKTLETIETLAKLQNPAGNAVSAVTENTLGQAGSSAGYCSLKVPALNYEAQTLHRLAQHASKHGQRLHFDSHGPETAEPTLYALETLYPHYPRLGLTIPGRWARSPSDAAWAAKRNVRVRVVKGQWPCPQTADRDPREGFLAVIDSLAGRVQEVAVATHDAVLAQEAARRLTARGTAFELELLCGLPRRAALARARSEQWKVRLYVPFGQAWLPYALGQVLRQPALWPRLLMDSMAGARRGGA